MVVTKGNVNITCTHSGYIENIQMVEYMRIGNEIIRCRCDVTQPTCQQRFKQRVNTERHASASDTKFQLISRPVRDAADAEPSKWQLEN